MQTFKGTVAIDFKAVVPQQFLDAMRAEAKADDATPFLKQVQAKHPENDDAFIAAVIKNGVRINVRDQLVKLFESTGLGGSVSPAKLEVIEIPYGLQDVDVKPQLASDINEASTPINAVHDPVDPA